jgi:hypothetical protein
LAQGASEFGAIEYSGKLLYVVGLGKTPDEAGRAVTLLEYVRNWKGTLVFSRGRLVKNLWKTMQVIDCYLDGSSCADSRAYCCEVIDDPADEDSYEHGLSFCIRLVEEPPETELVLIDQYLFPCKQIRRQVDLRPGHPSSVRDRIEAAAVDADVVSCPLFDPDLYSKIGTKMVTREVRR